MHIHSYSWLISITLSIFVFADYPKVNFTVVERFSFLLGEIFGPVESSVVFAETSAIIRASAKRTRAIFGDSAGGWSFLNRKEDILTLFKTKKDIPHCWNESIAQTGARRDPTDPREYWCWRRCLSSQAPINLKDVFNPDRETWLNGCQAFLELVSLAVLAGSGTSPKST